MVSNIGIQCADTLACKTQNSVFLRSLSGRLVIMQHSWGMAAQTRRLANDVPVIGSVVRRWVAGTSKAVTSMQSPSQRVRSAVALGA